MFFANMGKFLVEKRDLNNVLKEQGLSRTGGLATRREVTVDRAKLLLFLGNFFCIF